MELKMNTWADRYSSTKLQSQCSFCPRLYLSDDNNALGRIHEQNVLPCDVNFTWQSYAFLVVTMKINGLLDGRNNFRMANRLKLPR